MKPKHQHYLSIALFILAILLVVWCIASNSWRQGTILVPLAILAYLFYDELKKES